MIEKHLGAGDSMRDEPATAPVEDLEIDLHVVSLSYLGTFGLAGRRFPIVERFEGGAPWA